MANANKNITKLTNPAETFITHADDAETAGYLNRFGAIPSTSLRELIWLDDICRGSSIKEIAIREGLSCRRIQRGVSRAREKGGRLSSRESDSNCKVQRQNRHVTANEFKLVRENSHRTPRLVPLFPIGAFTPRSTCPHHGPIRSGSVFCCMVCSQSGLDDHPALKRDPITDPHPERKVLPVARVAEFPETRKQRRQRVKAC